MKIFYSVKQKLFFNTSPKGRTIEVLVSADSEKSALDLLNKHTQNAISNPKKTTYVYSKEEDRYIPIVTPAGEDDCRLISSEVILIKETSICCFLGNPEGYVYLAKIRADYISIKSISDVAIGAKDFDEAYCIIKNAFKDPKFMAKLLISKEVSDQDCENASFDIDSIKTTQFSVII